MTSAQSEIDALQLRLLGASPNCEQVGAHDLPDGTADDGIDMIAKAMLIRMGTLTYAGQHVATITWDDLERAADLECEIVKHPDGLTIRSKSSARN